MYVAEILSSASPMHGAFIGQKRFNRGCVNNGDPTEHAVYAVVDAEARPRREVAYGLKADADRIVEALNSALHRSVANVG